MAQRYEMVASGDPAAPEGPSCTLVSRNPRVLGGSPAPGVAESQVGVAARPSAGADPAAVLPGPADSASAPVEQLPVPASPVQDELASSAAGGVRQWIQILEPREWAGEGLCGLTVQARRSVRVAGTAMHPSGAVRVDIDGRPAAVQPDPGGGLRFVGYVPADTATREVVITDACHSAGVSGQFATRDLGINQINSVFLVQLNTSTGGLVVFTASGANLLSQEDERWGGGHGVFTHYLAGQENETLDQYRRAVRLDPSNASFHRNLAHVLIRSGKLQNAVAELRHATALAPDDAAYHTALGGRCGAPGSRLRR